jgi:hypothetical protein
MLMLKSLPRLVVDHIVSKKNSNLGSEKPDLVGNVISCIYLPWLFEVPSLVEIPWCQLKCLEIPNLVG